MSRVIDSIAKMFVSGCYTYVRFDSYGRLVVCEVISFVFQHISYKYYLFTKIYKAVAYSASVEDKSTSLKRLET